LLDWAVIIAGAAVLVGVFNLTPVHMEKFRTRQKSENGVYWSFPARYIFGLGVGLGPNSPGMQIAANAIIVL
jgi:hypothetical protein